jgi:hypothetical protein
MKMSLTGAIEILKLHKHTTDKFKHSIGDQYVSDAIDTLVKEVEKPTYTAEEIQDFAEWCSKNAELVADNEWVVYYGEGNTYKATTAQLREMWEQEGGEK